MKNADKLAKLKADIRKSVEKIQIKPPKTTEGEIQREAFRIRWGKRPENL